MLSRWVFILYQHLPRAPEFTVTPSGNVVDDNFDRNSPTSPRPARPLPDVYSAGIHFGARIAGVVVLIHSLREPSSEKVILLPCGRQPIPPGIKCVFIDGLDCLFHYSFTALQVSRSRNDRSGGH